MYPVDTIHITIDIDYKKIILENIEYMCILTFEYLFRVYVNNKCY